MPEECGKQQAGEVCTVHFNGKKRARWLMMGCCMRHTVHNAGSLKGRGKMDSVVVCWLQLVASGMHPATAAAALVLWLFLLLVVTQLPPLLLLPLLLLLAFMPLPLQLPPMLMTCWWCQLQLLPALVILQVQAP